MNATRRGSILIIVAGIIAMLAAVSAAFMSRMRQDAQESDLVVNMGQCRMMLHAGMQFIQESSRLGYATQADRSIEGWGWIDVRDGSIGPKDNNGNALWVAGKWPAVGTVKRAPMYMVKRPPFAVVPNMYPNKIPNVTDPAIDPNYINTFGIPILAKPDPMPALDPLLGAQDPTNAAQLSDWEKGDLEPDMRSLGLGWFRIYRETGDPIVEVDRPAKAGPKGATFIITVGSGSTQGFRDWPEVVTEGKQALFYNDQKVFDAMLAPEVRQWYRVEWSAAVGGGDMRFFSPLFELKNWRIPNSYHARGNLNVSRSRDRRNGGETYSTPEPRNYVGTISYIERLQNPPVNGRW